MICLLKRVKSIRLFTIRSDGQFNTTVYSLDDRFRGVYGTRMVLLMHVNDMKRLALVEGDRVTAPQCLTIALHVALAISLYCLMTYQSIALAATFQNATL